GPGRAGRLPRPHDRTAAMSDPMSVAIALAVASAVPSAPDAPSPMITAAPLTRSISLEVPALDGARGAAVNYERRIAGRPMSWLVGGELREAARGDYASTRIGVTGDYRWYWRAACGAWLSRLAADNLVGWYVGGGVAIAFDRTYDHADHRSLGTTLQLGLTGKVGYRIAPWRALAITPIAGVEVERDLDLRGRLPAWSHAGVIVGLDVGWMFGS
ncbi:MAG: hypothetical protein NT062_17965, partial [Proteobacteria bacterium]|nr:hypothetical protein [Pseudomonadota bacterium]